MVRNVLPTYTFYRKTRGGLPPGVSQRAAEIGARSSLVGAYLAQHPDAEARRELMRETCALSLDQCATLFARWSHESPQDPALAESLAKARTSHLAEALAPEQLAEIAALYESDAVVDEPVAFEAAQRMLDRYLRNYHHGAPFPPSTLHATWQRCAEHDPRCRAQLDRALAVGVGPALISRR